MRVATGKKLGLRPSAITPIPPPVYEDPVAELNGKSVVARSVDDPLTQELIRRIPGKDPVLVTPEHAMQLHLRTLVQSKQAHTSNEVQLVCDALRAHPTHAGVQKLGLTLIETMADDPQLLQPALQFGALGCVLAAIRAGASTWATSRGASSTCIPTLHAVHSLTDIRRDAFTKAPDYNAMVALVFDEVLRHDATTAIIDWVELQLPGDILHEGVALSDVWSDVRDLLRSDDSAIRTIYPGLDEPETARRLARARAQIDAFEMRLDSCQDPEAPTFESDEARHEYMLKNGHTTREEALQAREAALRP